jgi:glycosyltransferase involved in cell wall biosynthesis
MVPAASRRVIRMLFFVREPFPTFRVDVEVLFARELLSRGHAIDFVMQAASEDVPTGAQTWNGRTVWVGRTDSGSGFLRRLRKEVLGVLNDLTAFPRMSLENYDAVQVRDKFFVGAAAVLLARARGLKFFFWLSFPRPEARRRRARDGNALHPWLTYAQGVISGWLLYRWILPRCDHVFVQSEQMRMDLARRGISPDRMTSVPMGIAAEEIPPPAEPRSFGSAEEDLGPEVAYLGTLNPQRKLEVLVDMIGLLREQGLRATLLLIGDGERPSDRARLLHRARELGVADSVEITGFLPRGQALARLSRADFCISPFFPTPELLSTSPTKLVEYLAVGVPVVANNHPEQRSVLRACKAGVCVPWGARYFSRAVMWLTRHSGSERYLMGQRGRVWVLQNRTYERIAANLERTYVSLLGT